MIESNTDVVVIGGGIAGSAISVVLAEAGLSILMLEKSLEHKDEVRGEWMAPWGVTEAVALGLHDRYMAHGAHRPSRHVGYNDLVTPAQAEADSVDLTAIVDHPPLCLGHPSTCNLLNDIALDIGVTFLRGIGRLKVTPGSPPEVTFVHQAQEHTIQPRWVIGADGRNGVVAKQIGCITTHDPEDHLFSGMLVEGAHDWPEDLQVIGTEGDVNVLAFPQGGGKVRVYLGWPSEQRNRLVGPEGPQHFLDAWRLKCIPYSDAIADATPISPCIAYPNYDAWLDSPVREGVILIGDAAGRNDPITGQGLSISHRDVRLVRDALLGEANWRVGMFDDYLTERQDRMSRLRTTARLYTLRDSAFGEDGYQLRSEIHHRLISNNDLAAPFSAAFMGPDALPAEVFAPAFTTQIAGRPIWD